MKIPKSAIPKFAGIKKDLLTDADNSDLRKAIKDAVPVAVAQTKALAPYFRGSNERETCKRIFDYLKKNVRYQADDWRQVVQMPSAILRPGAVADCKSMSLFTAAILQNLGIPWHFVLASYTNSAIPGHIYVQTDSGCIIDVVWGKFDSEKKANHRYKMKVSYLAGTGGGPAIPSGNKSGGMLGATEGAVEWAKRNRVWDQLSNAQKVQVGVLKVAPPAIIGRNVILTAIARNAGGLATMLGQLSMQAGPGPNFSQESWNKKRSIEMEWLKKGGNPNELDEAINKGRSQTAKGRLFAKVMKMKSEGKSVRVDQWVGAVISALFGKKAVNGIGDPATGAAVAGSSAFWVPLLQTMAATIGTAVTAAVLAKVNPAEGEAQPGPEPEPDGPGPGGSGGDENFIDKYKWGLVAAAAIGAWYFLKKK